VSYYRVQWHYSSSLTTAHGGRWEAGQVVNLLDPLAVAILADSPGVLVPMPGYVLPDPGESAADVYPDTEGTGAGEGERQVKRARNRQYRRAANR